MSYQVVPSLAALKIAVSGAGFRRAVVVALVVGSVLNIINQGDAVLKDGHVNIVKLLLTYLVPFFVCVYGAAAALAMPRSPPASRADTSRP